MAQKGILCLVPTPISDTAVLRKDAQETLLEKALLESTLLLVEEHKEARRRWLRYGLPRDAIEKFILFNEHTHKELLPRLIKELKAGRNIYLMSDCGLPAFYDPGQNLVRSCHENKIKVTSFSFDNSIALAIALSGLDHQRFIFEGIVPIKKETRLSSLKRIATQRETTVLLDTPYRLHRLMSELNDLCPHRECFIGLNLNAEDERLLFGEIKNLNQKLPEGKFEFIMVLGSLDAKKI